MLSSVPNLGAPLDEIDTPALVLDLDAFERNLQSMARFCASAGVRLRPHAKTHKCVEVAKRQIALGAVGQCCQKVSEAEVLVNGGIGDVLVSNEVVGERKLDRLASLSQRATIGLCFDDASQVQEASRAAQRAGVTLGGLVEIEVGMQRCGVLPGLPASDLAQAHRERAGAPLQRHPGVPRQGPALPHAGRTQGGDRLCAGRYSSDH
ncbi:MAG: alanine racemase [Tepidisphaeraceae bacterium]